MDKVRIRWAKPTGSGRREGWGKVVFEIADDEQGARAFCGDYLRDRVMTEVPVGAVILEVSPQGSVKNAWQRADIYRVSAEGELVDCYPTGDELDWRKDFLLVKDRMVEMLSQERSLDPVVAVLGKALTALMEAYHLSPELSPQQERISQAIDLVKLSIPA